MWSPPRLETIVIARGPFLMGRALGGSSSGGLRRLPSQLRVTSAASLRPTIPGHPFPSVRPVRRSGLSHTHVRTLLRSPPTGWPMTVPSNDRGPLPDGYTYFHCSSSRPDPGPAWRLGRLCAPDPVSTSPGCCNRVVRKRWTVLPLSAHPLARPSSTTPDRASFDLESLGCRYGAAYIPCEAACGGHSTAFSSIIAATGHGGVDGDPRPVPTTTPRRSPRTWGPPPGVRAQSSTSRARMWTVLGRRYPAPGLKRELSHSLYDPRRRGGALRVVASDGRPCHRPTPPLLSPWAGKDMFIVGVFNAYPAVSRTPCLRLPDVQQPPSSASPTNARRGGMALRGARSRAGTSAADIIEWPAQMAHYNPPTGRAGPTSCRFNATGNIIKDLLRERAHAREPAHAQLPGGPPPSTPARDYVRAWDRHGSCPEIDGLSMPSPCIWAGRSVGPGDRVSLMVHPTRVEFVVAVPRRRKLGAAARAVSSRWEADRAPPRPGLHPPGHGLATGPRRHASTI